MKLVPVMHILIAPGHTWERGMALVAQFFPQCRELQRLKVKSEMTERKAVGVATAPSVS